ncbi:hypothetical protein K439DRAFT_1353865 [Ramaria rubella]|nr:hypothetical protein K439DRAFT_1353865 [Ramaria rubella]
MVFNTLLPLHSCSPDTGLQNLDYWDTDRDIQVFIITLDEEEVSGPLIAAYKYKKVVNKTVSIPMSMLEQYRNLQKIPSDPLISLPKIPTNPPEFKGSDKFTAERRDKMNINPEGFLWPKEVNLVYELIRLQEAGIAWDILERGSFREDYFKPIAFPVVPHIPWAEKNIPIPPGIYNNVVALIKEKLSVGVYEPSNL